MTRIIFPSTRILRSFLIFYDAIMSNCSISHLLYPKPYQTQVLCIMYAKGVVFCKQGTTSERVGALRIVHLQLYTDFSEIPAPFCFRMCLSCLLHIHHLSAIMGSQKCLSTIPYTINTVINGESFESRRIKCSVFKKFVQSLYPNSCKLIITSHSQIETMMHRNVSIALIFTITVVCHYAYRPSQISRGSACRTSLLSNNDDYYNLLNRNENTVASAVTNSLNPYEIDRLNKGLVGTQAGFISSVPACSVRVRARN